MSQAKSPMALAEATRSWRQSHDEQERSVLWAKMERLAKTGGSVFETAPYRPCAVQEAVSSGSIEALNLMAKAAERSGENMAEGLNATDCSVAFGKGRSSRPQSIIELAWLCGSGLAQSQGRICQMIERLTELGADPEGLQGSRGAPLQAMAGLGLIGPALSLIKAGADPNGRDEEGATALHKLLRRSDDASAGWRALIEAGADPTIKNKLGQTPQEAADPVQSDWLFALKEREALQEGSAQAPARAAAPRV